MQPRTRIGLVAGAIGLVLNTCVAGMIGVCGPVLALIAGAAAGFFAVQEERPETKNEGARTGAMAGGIAGGLTILGQMVGSVVALVLIQTRGLQIGFRQPPPSGELGAQVAFYGTGIAAAICFGIAGEILAAGAGAAAGYLATPASEIIPPAQNAR